MTSLTQSDGVVYGNSAPQISAEPAYGLGAGGVYLCCLRASDMMSWTGAGAASVGLWTLDSGMLELENKQICTVMYENISNV